MPAFHYSDPSEIIFCRSSDCVMVDNSYYAKKLDPLCISFPQTEFEVLGVKWLSSEVKFKPKLSKKEAKDTELTRSYSDLLQSRKMLLLHDETGKSTEHSDMKLLFFFSLKRLRRFKEKMNRIFISEFHS